MNITVPANGAFNPKTPLEHPSKSPFHVDSPVVGRLLECSPDTGNCWGSMSWCSLPQRFN